MANRATIVLQIILNPQEEILNPDIMQEILSELKRISYEDFHIDYESEDVSEVTMSTAWTAPIDDFQRICNFYGCALIGVGYEFGNAYVVAFELYSEENDYDEITKDPKKGFETIEKLPINDGEL